MHKGTQKCTSKAIKLGKSQQLLATVVKQEDHHSKQCHCSSWNEADSILVDKLAALFICASANPVSVVEQEYLRCLLALVSGHKYILPHRTKMREIITDEGATVFAEVAAELGAAEGISFTSDG